MEGLDKKAILGLVNVLAETSNTMRHGVDRLNIQTLVFSCCTQSVLAQVLKFLMKQEETYVRKNRPDLQPKKPDVLDRVANLLIGESNQAKRSKNRIHKNQDTLLLHSELKARVDEQNYMICYDLKWKVVPTDTPEEIEGRWSCQFFVKFFMREKDVGVEADLNAVREVFV